MKRTLLVCALALAPMAAMTQTTSPAKTTAAEEHAHRNEDVARHRAMAKAHEEAARCLEAGTAEKQCHQKLRDACKGLAVGQYCGMRHAH